MYCWDTFNVESYVLTIPDLVGFPNRTRAVLSCPGDVLALVAASFGKRSNTCREKENLNHLSKCLDVLGHLNDFLTKYVEV